MKSLQGQLLVATRELRDPNFAQTVVLIFRHDDDGAAGLVLNRPTKATVKQVWDQVSQTPCETLETLRVGGPCQGPLMAVHAQQPLGEIEVRPGIYFSAGSDNLQQLVTQSDTKARFFVGYAGWGVGQLEREMKEGSWLVAPASPDLVFDRDDELWESLTRSVTASSLLGALGIKHVPKDVSLN